MTDNKSSNKKNILIIHSSLGGGGAERVLIDILHHLDYTKYVIDLVLINGTGAYLQDIPNDVNYLGSVYNKGRSLIKRIISRINLSHLYEKREIKKLVCRKYDTIISFMEGIPLKYHGYVLNLARKNISWVHSDLHINHWSRFSFTGTKQELSLYQRMNKVVFVSESAKDGFEKLFSCNISDRGVVIYNPIDKNRITKEAKAFDVEKTGLTIIAVGRICEQKRYDRLLKATKLLVDRGYDFTLKILGTGILKSEMKSLCHTLCLDSNVEFLGYVENPYPYIKNSDVLVLSSDVEGYPTVVCEAMTLGIPVVATNISGTLELTDNSIYGILTECSAEALADAMAQIMYDSKLRNDLSHKSLERSKTFNISNTMLQIEALL